MKRNKLFYYLPVDLMALYSEIQHLAVYYKNPQFFNNIATEFRGLAEVSRNSPQYNNHLDNITRQLTHLKADKTISKEDSGLIDNLLPLLKAKQVRAPLQVDPEHIQENGKLISDEAIEALWENKTLQANKDIRHSKKQLGEHINFSIMKLRNRLYAIYKGNEQNKLVGHGGNGKIKLMQDLQSGEWVILKININGSSLMGEANILSYLDDLKGIVHTQENEYAPMKTHMATTRFQGDNLTISQIGVSTAKALSQFYLAALDMVHLHQLGILHGDIKPENMVGNQHEVHMVDFGGAQLADNIGATFAIYAVPKNDSEKALLQYHMNSTHAENTYILPMEDVKKPDAIYYKKNDGLESIPVENVPGLTPLLDPFFQDGKTDKDKKAMALHLANWHLQNKLVKAVAKENAHITPEYAAPELFHELDHKQPIHYTLKTDAYAFGVSLASLLNEESLKKKSDNGPLTLKERWDYTQTQITTYKNQDLSQSPEHAKDLHQLVCGLLENAPEERSTLYSVLPQLKILIPQFLDENEKDHYLHLPSFQAPSQMVTPVLLENVLATLHGMKEKVHNKSWSARLDGKEKTEKKLDDRILAFETALEKISTTNKNENLSFQALFEILASLRSKITHTSRTVQKIESFKKKAFKSDFFKKTQKQPKTLRRLEKFEKNLQKLQADLLPAPRMKP